ncbi:MAG TPA: YdcF family protein, partial [Cyanobacteria bacterium UBA8543]|nr:YdcF family protein [Cyanobacteria bacterium UBA8543]
MFDSPLCKRPFTQVPLFFNWGELEGLKNILVVAVLILVFLGIRWILQQSKWKRWLRSPKGSLSLIGFTAALLIVLSMADRGLTLFLPKDSGTAVEAIVLLGRGTEFGLPRINLAAKLWQAKRAPIIFHSGMGDTPRTLPLLEAKGIPKRAIDGENCSMTTPENAIFSAAILQAQGIKRILLVTDPPHMWRSLLEFSDEGFTVIPHTSPMPTNMSFLDKSFLTFREYFFLIALNIKRLFPG